MVGTRPKAEVQEAASLLPGSLRGVPPTPSKRITVVREARQFRSDPDSYAKRDYYYEFRNTLRKTHWHHNDISTFEAALEPVAAKQTIPRQGRSLSKGWHGLHQSLEEA